ncbi:hybrid sensor histidine kinase/response regulator [Piscinibacter terrae]|uniref:histidine kinase n=1 Tax=Piscinibacter terrae TaxID=2496871 RepID=A0A3N7HPX2_9BURK|nr:ATP-binding protein [Albitalea terrae]RQP22801.1 response regulator [Albitalea terrae]
MAGVLGARDQAERDRLFELSLDMLCVAGFDGYFKQVNPAWSRTLGWSEAELLAFSWKDLVHPDDRRASREAGKALFAGMPSVCFENRHRCKDGSYRWLSWNAYPVVADQTIFAVVRDITAQKLTEQHRIELETRLRESQRLEALGTLAGGIAHDFNNILATVLGNTTLAMEGIAPDHPAMERLRHINKAGLRAGDLVRQILAFSKNFSPELSRHSLKRIVESAVSAMRPDLPAGIALELLLCEEHVHVMADPQHLHQVVVNLCSNAVQSMQGLPGKVEVGVERLDIDAAAERPAGLPAGEYARVWVADSGCGMDESLLGRIFEPFFTTRAVGQGVGLGLSAVHGVVSSHGGAVSADSTPGLGSTFHVYLPLADSMPHAEQAPHASDAARSEVQHVLYVDDDETVMILMDALLKRAGYRVTCHSDPHAAVSAVRREPQSFDLIITDFNMPALTGLGLAADVARIRADLPVVIHSGHISDSVRTEAARLGVRGVVNKGGSFDELGAVVQRILASQ